MPNRYDVAAGTFLVGGTVAVGTMFTLNPPSSTRDLVMTMGAAIVVNAICQLCAAGLFVLGGMVKDPEGNR